MWGALAGAADGLRAVLSMRDDLADFGFAQIVSCAQAWRAAPKHVGLHVGVRRDLPFHTNEEATAASTRGCSAACSVMHGQPARWAAPRGSRPVMPALPLPLLLQPLLPLGLRRQHQLHRWPWGLQLQDPHAHRHAQRARQPGPLPLPQPRTEWPTPLPPPPTRRGY